MILLVLLMLWLVRHEPILNVVSDEACRPERLPMYNEQEVSNMLYSFGILNFRHDLLLANLCEILRRPELLRDWTEQGLANTIYGLALLEYRPPNETMFALIWETCRQGRLQRFYNQHLMNVLYGMVTLGVRSYRVLRCLLDELLQRRSKFKFMLTGLSSIVYSFAKAGIYADGIRPFLEDLTSTENIGNLTDWSLTNLLCAFGSFPDEEELLPFLSKLIKEAVKVERLIRYTERNFAQILFGISKTGLRTKIEPAYISHLVEGATVPGFLPEYTDQGLANVVYALTHLGYVSREVHDRIAVEVTCRIKDCEGITLATFVYTWSRIPFKDTAFIEEVTSKLKTDNVVDSYSEHILGNLLLGLVRLDVKDRGLFQILTKRIQRPDIWKDFLYVTSPQCMKELVNSEYLDAGFREALERNLKHIYLTRESEQTHKMKM